MTKECTIEVKIDEGTITVKAKDCGPQTKIALYSYADTGQAQFDSTKEQTLLDHGQNKAEADFACGVDFQADVFKGDVIEDVPTNLYGDRLVAYRHVDGPGECQVTTTTSTTSTTTSSTTTSSTTPASTTSSTPSPTSSTFTTTADPGPTTTPTSTEPSPTTLVSVPDPTTSTSLLPFTGGHEATFLQIGAPLMIAGVLLTTWSKLRLRAVPVR